MKNVPLSLMIFLLLIGVSGVLFSQSQTTAATTTTEESKDVAAPPMNLTTNDALPSKFRGGDPDSGLVHVLEDESYKRQEHTILYEEDASALEGADSTTKFDGPPTINWTTKKVNADGTLTTLSNENTNSATNNSMFPDPGHYQVGNGGARQVSGEKTEVPDGEPTQEQAGTTAGGTDGTGETGETGEAATTGEATTAGETTTETQRVTSNQTMGVEAHDCTAPNIWAVIQEGAGTTQLAASEPELREQLRAQMHDNGGQLNADTELKGGLKEANLIAVFEAPVNCKPKEKTAAVAIKGMTFEESGKKVVDAKSVQMSLLDDEQQTRLTSVGEESLRGVFVRRSIPFLVAAQMSDNYQFDPDEATCVVVNKATGSPVDKVDGAYLFRVPNYPRTEYQEQPDYELQIDGKDFGGNVTKIRLPIFVVNTQASFEGGRNE